jgi:hypothetical protein
MTIVDRLKCAIMNSFKKIEEAREAEYLKLFQKYEDAKKIREDNK